VGFICFLAVTESAGPSHREARGRASRLAACTVWRRSIQSACTGTADNELPASESALGRGSFDDPLHHRIAPRRQERIRNRAPHAAVVVPVRSFQAPSRPRPPRRRRPTHRRHETSGAIRSSEHLSIVDAGSETPSHLPVVPTPHANPRSRSVQPHAVQAVPPVGHEQRPARRPTLGAKRN